MPMSDEKFTELQNNCIDKINAKCSASGSDELLPCPFCGGAATETQKGDNYVIVRCESLSCGVRPSAVCYVVNGGYDFYHWNTRL